MAQFMVSNKLSADDVRREAPNLDFPESVIDFFRGDLGQPYGGFPEPLRTQIIRNRPRIDGRPGLNMKPLDFKKIKTELREKYGKSITDEMVQSYAMYPKVRGQPLRRVQSCWLRASAMIGLRRVHDFCRKIRRSFSHSDS